MSTGTFTANIASFDDTKAKDWVTKFIAALDAFPTLTKVTSYNNVHLGSFQGALGGGAKIDLLDKTFTGGTTTAAGNILSGATWNTPLDPVSDVGRMIRINGAGATGGIYYGWILSYNAGTNVVTLSGASTTATAVAGTATGTIGVITGGATTGTNFYGNVIYRFNDALQSDLPIFIRFSLGQNGFSTTTAGSVVGVQFGTGIDANGLIVGATNSVTAPALFGATATIAGDTTTQRTWYLSAAAGRLSIACNADSTLSAPRGFMTLTRSINAAKAMTNEFAVLNVGNSGASAAKTWIYDRRSGSIFPNHAGMTPVLGSPTGAFTNLVMSGDTNVLLSQPLLGRLRNFQADYAAAKLADYGQGTTTQIDGDTFISVPNLLAGAAIANMSVMTQLMRYE